MTFDNQMALLSYYIEMATDALENLKNYNLKNPSLFFKEVGRCIDLISKSNMITEEVLDAGGLTRKQIDCLEWYNRLVGIQIRRLKELNYQFHKTRRDLLWI